VITNLCASIATSLQTHRQYNMTKLPVLTEVENILDNNSFDDLVLGGDFNYDKRRVTGFVLTITEFLERIELFSVCEKFQINFTHVHTDSRSTSIIVNERLLNQVTDAGPVHLGDNLSRHSPIMMKIQIEGLTASKIQQGVPAPRKPAWYKATPDHRA
jgi:RNase H-fold protein (predicted Holliday junction resolvase)